MSIYERLELVPVINAQGVYTDLGGATISPSVWQAMSEANRYSIHLPELLESAGRRMASLMEAEAAHIVPGASAGIALAIAAALTKSDGAKMEQLPDVSGIKSEIVIQSGHRYKYDRMVRLPGAALVEAGTGGTTTPSDLSSAIGSDTAAMFFPAHLDGTAGTVSLEDASTIAREASIPLIVDAAYLIYPLDVMQSFTARGADLAIFSAKYFYGPNAGGFACGRSDLIEHLRAVDFTGFESSDHLVFGRPFKMDRWTVVGVLAAFEEWVALDHRHRLDAWSKIAETIREAIPDIPGISARLMTFTMDERTIESEDANCIVLQVDEESGLSASELHERLRRSSPAVLPHLRDDTLIIAVDTVDKDDVATIVESLQREIAPQRLEVGGGS